MIHNRFTEHPASIGETWSQHARFALSCSSLLALASIAALVHAILPPLFKTTTRRTIDRLHAMFDRR
jgi:hypothetical protein